MKRGDLLSVRFTSYKKEVLSREQEKINRALEICGGTAERHAKENLTRNHSVQTGRLRASIMHKQIDDNTEIIGSNVDYAPYVELGTSRSKAKPYLRPAVQNHASEYKRIIRQELQK